MNFARSIVFCVKMHELCMLLLDGCHTYDFVMQRFCAALWCDKLQTL